RAPHARLAAAAPSSGVAGGRRHAVRVLLPARAWWGNRRLPARPRAAPGSAVAVFAEGRLPAGAVTPWRSFWAGTPPAGDRPGGGGGGWGRLERRERAQASHS